MSAWLGRMILGCIFTGAAISKFFSFPSFCSSLGTLTGMTAGPAAAAGGSVIAVELLLGGLLVTGRKNRRAALAAAAILTVFTIVLTVALMRGVDLPCNCLGLIGPQLPMRWQIIFDLGLILLALFLAYPVSDVSAPHVRVFGTAVLLVTAWAAVALWGADPAKDAGGPTDTNAPSRGSPLRDIVRRTGRKEMVLLANFADFGCQLCLDDFLAFCDSVNVRMPAGKFGLRLLARRDESRPESVQARLLKGWARGNGWTFPVGIDGEGLFERLRVDKTSVFVFDESGSILTHDRFPIGYQRRMEVLDEASG